MINNFIIGTITDIAEVNPQQPLPKGIVSKKIPMENVQIFNRKITGYENTQYKSGPKFKNGDTLLAKITPCLENGKTALVDILDIDEVAFGSSEFIVLRPKNSSDKKFLYYFAISPLFRKRAISSMEGTSGRKRVNDNTLRNYKFQFPNPDLRENIGDTLSLLDDKIELNNNINSQLELVAKHIFDYWFIQFDFPDKNGKPYKSSGGAMTWNDKLKKEIPEGWNFLSLANLIGESKNGDWGSDTPSGKSDQSFCIRGSDINGLNGIENFDPPIRYIDKSHCNRQLKPDDLIIEISGGSPTQSTGRMAHISSEVLARLGNKVVCSNFCKAISLKNPKLSFVISRYWTHLYNSKVFFNYEGKTSGIKNLLFDQLSKDVTIAIPTDEGIINEYYNLEENIDKQKQNNLQQNEEFAKLRDWLLPMFMNGQVKTN